MPIVNYKLKFIPKKSKVYTLQQIFQGDGQKKVF
jgi:hypothetical protein